MTHNSTAMERRCADALLVADTPFSADYAAENLAMRLFVVRAVIRAMREPTHEMTLAISTIELELAKFDVKLMRGSTIWRDMIDAASPAVTS